MADSFFFSNTELATWGYQSQRSDQGLPVGWLYYILQAYCLYLHISTSSFVIDLKKKITQIEFSILPLNPDTSILELRLAAAE